MPPNPNAPAKMSQQALFAHLAAEPSTLVLTGSVRTARTFLHLYNEWQQQKNLRAWSTPRILAWEVWLQEQWDALIITSDVEQTLLTDEQERSLWHSVLDKARVPFLHNENSLVETAMQSARIAQAYLLSQQQIQQSAEGVDAHSFARWLRLFASECSRLGLLPSAQLADTIRTHPRRNRLPWPEKIFLVGFDRLTPQQMQFLDDLRGHGRTITNLWLTPEEQSSAPPLVITAPTQQEELYAAAFWIRQRLEQNPSERIGVILPSVSAARPNIERIFRRVLAPDSLHVSNASPRLPYEFSLGEPLHTLPLIRSALLFLRWLTQPLAWEEASYCITAGHFENTTKDELARLDASLRTHLHSTSGTIALPWLLRFLQSNPKTENNPFLLVVQEATHLTRTENIMQQSGVKPSVRTYAEWGMRAENILRTMQWSLLQPKTSVEFQLLRRWSSVLDSIAAIDSVAAPVSFSAWLDAVQSATHRALFTLESHGAPVQILGVAESAGIPFDVIWFLDASAESWPARGQAQPWIPWLLQKQFTLPYADAQADYAHASHITQRILSTCKQAVFSFALEASAEESGPATNSASAVTRTSPVLQDILPHISQMDAHTLLPTLKNKMQPVASLSTLAVASEPPIPLPAANVRGGVRFLQLQAACPFRAFAELRLGSTPVEDPEPGIDPRTQGGLIHAVLHDFWSQVKTQAALLELSAKQRNELLVHCILSAQSEVHSHLPHEDLLLAIESERIAERLLAWLNVEAQRPEFFVAACEKTLEHSEIGGVHFDCRIDRIDQVGDGLALLDYKTGNIAASACRGDRPDEPQLPTYAVLMQNDRQHNAPLRGVAFAHLNAKQSSFKIIHSLSQTFQAKDPRNDKRNNPIVNANTLDTIVQNWRVTLENLAGEFRAGTSRVDPKHPRETCEHCEQMLLCRVRETSIHQQDSEDEEDADEGAAQENE